MPFDDRSGSKALDRSGKLNHGTLYGPTWVAGRRGSALSFDGVDDYVEVPDSPSLHVASTFTLAFWIKFSTLPSEFSPAKAVRLIGRPAGYDWFIYIDSNNKVHLTKYGVTDVESTTAFADNLLHHFGLVFVDADDNFKIYIDGSLDSTTAFTDSFTNGVVSLYLSCHQGIYSHHGLFDEVRIYNRALNAAEIKRHYESELFLARH